jgi:exopolysaccharide biosynthesis polyprenyl glycosylphosphotransferase
MSDREITQQLVQRLGALQHPLGRWRWQTQFQADQFCWRCWVLGTQILKRALDVVGSAAALVILSPLFLLIACLIKLEDRGPIFFVQTRVGKYGRLFRMYKFRSMCLNAEALLEKLRTQNQHQEGVTFKMKHDPRITRVGRWLRKLSLDELPQFYNVFLGDMSLVGPRPPVPREVQKYSLEHRRRLAVTPGITCIWQVSGRADIDFTGQVALDVQYIETQSFWVDLKILARTLPAVLSGKGAC